MSRRDRGFTLVELIIVVVLLTGLTILALGGIERRQTEYIDRHTKANMVTLRLCVETYKLDHDRYATTEEIGKLIQYLPMQGRQFLNPCTKQPVNFLVAAPGNIQYRSDGTTYAIYGFDVKGDTLPLAEQP